MGNRDLENVAENTKVVWACSQPVFPFKARDFCTVVHFRKLKDGTAIVLNRLGYTASLFCFSLFTAEQLD